MRSSTFFCPSGWSHDLEPGVGKLETEDPFLGGGRGWELPELSERRELEKAKRALEVQLAENDLLLKEVNHRVKNSFILHIWHLCPALPLANGSGRSCGHS